MELEELKNRLVHLNISNTEDIYELCLNAYSEGSMREKNIAIEAHRLRCGSLFGNKCMSKSFNHCQKTCDGNCNYIKSYKFELYKLES